MKILLFDPVAKQHIDVKEIHLDTDGTVVGYRPQDADDGTVRIARTIGAMRLAIYPYIRPEVKDQFADACKIAGDQVTRIMKLVEQSYE